MTAGGGGGGCAICGPEFTCRSLALGVRAESELRISGDKFVFGVTAVHEMSISGDEVFFFMVSTLAKQGYALCWSTLTGRPLISYCCCCLCVVGTILPDSWGTPTLKRKE